MPGPITSLKGIAFPYQRGAETMPKSNALGATVVDAIKGLLCTGIGEVPMAPNLGTRLYSFVFENMTPLTEARIANEMRLIIEGNEPRMRVLNIVTSRVGDDIGGWGVVVRIDYELNGESGVFTLEV